MSGIVDMFNRMNLDTPGLETVKTAIKVGDYPAAEAAYLAYSRTRKPPILNWHTEHRGGRSFETNSTGWNFLTAIPELITWDDEKKVKGLISREKGYTFSITEKPFSPPVIEQPKLPQSSRYTPYAVTSKVHYCTNELMNQHSPNYSESRSVSRESR